MLLLNKHANNIYLYYYYFNKTVLINPLCIFQFSTFIKKPI